MRIETKTASSTGVINLGMGTGLVAIPLRAANYGALGLELNGDPGQTLQYEPGRVLTLNPWSQARLTGVRAGSVWRIATTENAAEHIGELPRQPVVISELEVSGEITNGTYFLGNTFEQPAADRAPNAPFADLTLTESSDTQLIDVRGFSRVKFSVRSDNGVAGYDPAMHVKVYLEGYDEETMRAKRDIALGSSNEFATNGGVYGHVELGAATDTQSALEATVATTFAYVRPRFVFTGGPIEWDGGLLVTLWGFP